MNEIAVEYKDDGSLVFHKDSPSLFRVTVGTDNVVFTPKPGVIFDMKGFLEKFFMSTGEIAKKLGITSRKALELCKKEDFQGMVVLDGHYYVPEDIIEKYCSSQHE